MCSHKVLIPLFKICGHEPCLVNFLFHFVLAFDFGSDAIRSSCLISSEHDPAIFYVSFSLVASYRPSNHDSTQRVLGPLTLNVGAVSIRVCLYRACYYLIPVYLIRDYFNHPLSTFDVLSFLSAIYHPFCMLPITFARKLGITILKALLIDG